MPEPADKVDIVSPTFCWFINDDEPQRAPEVAHARLKGSRHMRRRLDWGLFLLDAA